MAVSYSAYNFLFTEPATTPSTSRDPENVPTLVLFSIAAVLTSGLAARARERAVARAQRRADAGHALRLRRKLASVATMDDLLWAAAHQIAATLKAEVVILLPGRRAARRSAAAYPPEDRLDDTDRAAAQWAFERDQAAGRGSDTLPGARRLFLPVADRPRRRRRWSACAATSTGRC